MATLRVNPTRMELLRLKKQVRLAQRGHKLLKEKRDGLMREFLKLVRQTRDLRSSVDAELSQSLRHFILAQSSMHPSAVRLIEHLRLNQINLSVSTKNVMSVHIPDFKIDLQPKKEKYGAWETSPELDIGLKSFQEILPKLLKLATLEKSAELLAQEIEKTRRRVNALEYVLIPNLQTTMRYIRMKLEEQERAAIITTMRVKQNMQD